MSYDIFKALREEMERKHNLYIVGFVKYRQTKEEEFQSWGKAAALFKKYKKKYRSAYMYTRRPWGVIMLEAVNAPNPLLDLIPKASSFCGEAISVPIRYGGKK